MYRKQRGAIMEVNKNLNETFSVIKVEHASKSFGKQQVLQDVSVSFMQGEISGIVGHNGSGKTVLFKAICGLLYLDEGSIYIRDKQMHKDINLITDAGVIIEEPAILGNASGYRNLDYLYRIRNKRNTEHLYQVMQKVGLEPKSKKKVKNYSMGMRQRLAIAQAIMEDQKILILDEPMNGLDKSGVGDMRKLFLDLKQQGKTIVLASHNKEDIDVLCDHVYEMEMGVLTPVR